MSWGTWTKAISKSVWGPQGKQCGGGEGEAQEMGAPSSRLHSAAPFPGLYQALSIDIVKPSLRGPLSRRCMEYAPRCMEVQGQAP